MNIIITGASKGIGCDTVKTFAMEEGNKIIAISRNKHLLEKLQMECRAMKSGKDVFILPCDLEREEQVTGIPARILEYFPAVDILINNAGLLLNRRFEDLTSFDFDRIFSGNVKSIYRLIQVLLPYFRAGSHIVNIGSMGGFQGSAKFPGLSLYSASKGAVAILSECLAEELKDRGIKVNCLALGSVQTQMFEDAFPGKQAGISPRQMAGFIAGFAKDTGPFINGKIIPVSTSTP